MERELNSETCYIFRFPCLPEAHSRHKNLATLIRYDDGRQQLQGKAAKILADAVSARAVERSVQS